MKTIFIGVIIVAIIIFAVILIVQQFQISDLEREETLRYKMSECGLIYAQVKITWNLEDDLEQARMDYAVCMDKALNDYGNDFQKQNWENIKEQRQLDEYFESQHSGNQNGNYPCSQYELGTYEFGECWRNSTP